MFVLHLQEITKTLLRKKEKKSHELVSVSVFNAVHRRILPAGETQLARPLVDMPCKYNLYTSAEYDLVPDFETHTQTETSSDSNLFLAEY